jgi:hypothetical protein
VAILALGCLLRGAGTVAQEPEQYSEDAIKAVFLYRFTSFVDWPAEPVPAAQFNIAVMNADGVADALRHLLPDHLIKNKPAQVRSIQHLRDLGDARILYLGAGSAADLAAIVAATAGHPVLVVSDMDRGLERGSTINFILVDRHVRFEVSLPAASRAGLKISSELLSVATRVMSGDNTDYDHGRDTRVVAAGAN